MTSSLVDKVKVDKCSGVSPENVCHFIRGDGLRLLYSVLLIQFTIDQVNIFISSIPLIKNSIALSTKEIVEKIWIHGSMFPTEYVVRFINSLESFCLQYNVDVTELVRVAYSELRYGMDLPVEVFTRAMNVSADMFTKSFDHRHWLIHTNETLTRIIAKNSFFSVCNVTNENGYQHEMVAFSLDKYFTQALPHLDCDLWMIPKIRYAPLCINYPPFDNVTIIADCRSVNEILADESVREVDGLFYVNSSVVGHVVDFALFLQNLGVDISKIENAETIITCNVIEIITPYFCEKRNREVLHAGCVYGAPFALFTIMYKIIEKNTQNTLSYFFRKSSSPHPAVWNKIKAKHRQLIRCLNTTYEFVYKADGDAIYCNDKLLVRNVPAKILKKVLIMYIDGIETFERKVLLDDPHIVYDRSNPGLEIRMQRLLVVLERLCPLFTIKRLERGVFKIESQCPVHLTETQ
jgi:hypothetical protein